MATKPKTKSTSKKLAAFNKMDAKDDVKEKMKFMKSGKKTKKC